MEKYKKFFINGIYSSKLKEEIIRNNSKTKLFTEGGRIYAIQNTLEEIYCVINDLEQVPKCVCGCDLKIKRFIVGFSDFCSTKCSNSEKIKSIDKSKYLVKKKYFNKDEITKEILQKYINVYGNVDTNFYKMCDFNITSEEVYLIFYNKEKQKCKMCSNDSIFMNFTSGYRDHCSAKCSNSNPERTIKIKETSMKKDKSGLNSYDKMVINMRKTNEENGRWNNEENLTKFEIYCKNIYKAKYKFKNEIKKLENYNKRGHLLTDYHLDHKYSKKQGFLDNIPEEAIGHICNLEMILGSKNLSKNKKCSITKEELLEAFYNYNK